MSRWNPLAWMVGWSIASACTCNSPPEPVNPTPTWPEGKRCEVPLDDFLGSALTGAYARTVATTDDLISGPNAQGRVGDVLLGNDKIKVIIQGKSRSISANPFGGTILDADLVRSEAEQDQFGEIGLMYNFGRTLRPDEVQVLADGSAGGPAIVAASGPDAANDYLAIRNQMADAMGNAPSADPDVALPLYITNYFILAPGESRVRYVTAFCNEGDSEVVLSAGDVVDPGYVLEFFNGQSCTGGFGFGGLCYGLDRASWFGYLGQGVAYGYAPYRLNSADRPELSNALLTVAGITGVMIGGEGLNGMATWFNPAVTERAGAVKISPGKAKFIARDFVVGKDLGEVASLIETYRSQMTSSRVGEVSGKVTAGGKPVHHARVTYKTDSGLAATFSTDAQGAYRGTLTSREYTVRAWAPGHAPSAAIKALVSASTPVDASFALVPARQLHVTIRDPAGKPMPGRVTVLCAGGVCPTPNSQLVEFSDVGKDPLVDSIQQVAFAGASGEVTLKLPPGAYQVVVSRGPEYSIYPNSWPATPGVAVDLSGADASVAAVLTRVLDTQGFMSADFHVHAVNSPDSIVDNLTRVTGFAADGVDIIVSTDHDVVTDYAPYIREASLEPYLASVVGEEVSTMSHGHYNLFPLTRDESSLTGGALDWAGHERSTLRPEELFAEARRMGAKTIHFNHPRGFLGGFTHLRVDTDTLATRASPSRFQMAPSPHATEHNTHLLSADFNALEVMNNGEDRFEVQEIYPRLNDWFTLLSRGLRVAATGTSDTHYRSTVAGWRTWVETGTDQPASLDPIALSTALNALKATVSNGLFVTTKAYRVDAQGTQTSPEARMGGTVSASGDEVEIEVDIQAPEYLDVTRVELYTHRPEDDATCPLDPQSPRALTTRVACDGQANRNWPSSGITASRDITLSAAHLEPVLTHGAETYRRWRVRTRFTLPAPTTDNWLVVLVYGSKSMFPLLFNPASAGSASKPVLPFAVTNPIFVDADGNGYDKPPFTPTLPGPAPAPPSPSPPPVGKEAIYESWGRHFHTH